MGDVETLRELLAAYADVQRRAFELPSPLTPTNRWQELTARFGKPFVGQHIGARVRLLRRCILVSRRMDRREQTALVDEIDRLLPLWPERPLMTLLLTYLSPILAIATPIGRFVAPG